MNKNYGNLQEYIITERGNMCVMRDIKSYIFEDIKNWINSIADQFKTVIRYKRTDTMHVIVVPYFIESYNKFRDIALDFLMNFDQKYEEDIIIVSEEDNFYSFDIYDYDTSRKLLEEDFLFVTYSAITEKVNSSAYDNYKNGLCHYFIGNGIRYNLKSSHKNIINNISASKESCILV